MSNYVMSAKEYDALDRILTASHLGQETFRITQRDVFDADSGKICPCDYIVDEEGGLLELSDGLEEITMYMEGDGRVDALTHYGLTDSEKAAFKALLEKFDIDCCY